MNKTLCLTFFLIIAVGSSRAQGFDSLKLTPAEIPAGYKIINEPVFKTPHASSLYQQMEMYESFLGKLIQKDFQSFDKKGDSGSILYFQFAEAFSGQQFLNGLLWGSDGQPSKSEPDEYYVKGNILIVWSFSFKSNLKSISKEKVERVLKLNKYP